MHFDAWSVIIIFLLNWCFLLALTKMTSQHVMKPKAKVTQARELHPLSTRGYLWCLVSQCWHAHGFQFRSGWSARNLPWKPQSKWPAASREKVSQDPLKRTCQPKIPRPLLWNQIWDCISRCWSPEPLKFTKQTRYPSSKSKNFLSLLLASLRRTWNLVYYKS